MDDFWERMQEYLDHFAGSGSNISALDEGTAAAIRWMTEIGGSLDLMWNRSGWDCSWVARGKLHTGHGATLDGAIVGSMRAALASRPKPLHAD